MLKVEEIDASYTIIYSIADRYVGILSSSIRFSKLKIYILMTHNKYESVSTLQHCTYLHLTRYEKNNFAMTWKIMQPELSLPICYMVYNIRSIECIRHLHDKKDQLV